MNLQDLNIMELNFEGMKRILTATTETSKQEEVNKEKRELLAKRLKEDDFDDLMQFTEASVSPWKCFIMLFIKNLSCLQHNHIQNKLNELFNSLAMDRPFIDNSAIAKNQSQKPVYERNFPELFFF